MDETAHVECFKGRGELHSCRDVGVSAVVAVKCVRVCPQCHCQLLEA